MKIRLLTQESFSNWPKNRSGSARIRGRWLVKYWDGAEEYQIGEKPDVMIFQKAYWRDMMQELDCIKILDICDPDFLDKNCKFGIVEMMSYVDACVTSTEALRDLVSQYTKKPVICIPDRFDLELFKDPKSHTDAAKKVIWYGYAHNARVLDSARSSIIDLGLKLIVVSDEGVMDADEWYKYDWATIHAYMKQADIALMPNHSSRKYKSNNKVIESYLCGLPVAANYEELKRFIDPVERQKEVDEKIQYARREYNIQLSVSEYISLIDSLCNEVQ